MEDVALNFVEEVVGANNFSNNWHAFKKKPQARQLTRAWLQKHGQTPDKQELLWQILDHLRIAGKTWYEPDPDIVLSAAK